MDPHIQTELNISNTKLLQPKYIGPVRRKLVELARGFRGGTLPAPRKYIVWREGDFEIGFLKPGKESAPDFQARHKNGTTGPNPDDMAPTIWKAGARVTAPATFEEIFHVFELLLKKNQESAMEILAGVLYRSAFLLDYSFPEPVGAMPEYKIPDRALTKLAVLETVNGGIPAVVYLKYLQLIAWNEDVKYSALGFDIEKERTGRVSNLLTYTYLIAVLIGRMPLAYFCYAFARTKGVAPISNKATSLAFPWLRTAK